jgi:hypothetical protein
VTYRSHWKQKHMFDAMCHDAHFMDNAQGPLEHEK